MNLLILGAGQYGTVAKEIAEKMGCFEKIDFLDDNNQVAIGKLNEFGSFFGEYDAAVVAIGLPKLRLDYLSRLKKTGYKLPVLIHPQSYISTSAKCCEGCIVEAFVGVNANARIGEGCILSMGCIVNHDAAVGDGCHIDCGAIVPARMMVDAGVKVNCGIVYGAGK